MEFTYRQELYIYYMLKRIGFEESDLSEYLEIFSNQFDKYNYNLNERQNWFENTSNCITAIKEEFELKKNLALKDKKISNLISATDISNYVFCSANFSINNSYSIDFPKGAELTEEGKKLHEDLKAIKKSWVKEKGDNLMEKNKDLSLIKNSKLIFSGHNSDSKVFKNENWVGSPDYILQDNNGDYFVVEEKFRFVYDPGKKSGAYYNFYSYMWDCDEHIEDEYREQENQWKKSNVLFYKNNIFQTVSYIHNIKEYDIKYGILIYWYYDYTKDKKPYVHKVATIRIKLNDELINEYNEIKKSIEKLIKKEEIEFVTDVNSFNKCINCVVSNYCGHKTKKFSKLNYPYSKNFLKLKFEHFPEVLKKKDNT